MFLLKQSGVVGRNGPSALLLVEEEQEEDRGFVLVKDVRLSHWKLRERLVMSKTVRMVFSGGRGPSGVNVVNPVGTKVFKPDGENVTDSLPSNVLETP